MSTIAHADTLRERAIAGIGRLPPFSPVLMKVLASLSRDGIMVAELGDWIEKDTVLTGNVMRMVNSAAYGRIGTVSSVRNAITILGTNRIRNVVLGLSVCNMMAQLKLPAMWSTKQFNLHAVAVANLADLFVQNVDAEYSEGAFVAGLLHDVGKLLLAVTCPEEYSLIIAETIRTGRDFHEVELERLGFSHPELSLSVLEAWKLPDAVQAAARYHHEPDANAGGALGKVLYVADLAANGMGFPAVMNRRDTVDPVPMFELLGLGGKSERILKSFDQELTAIRGVL